MKPRGPLAALAALFLAAAAGAQAPGQSDLIGDLLATGNTATAIYNAEALAPLLRALPPAPGQSVSIVQVGDSHTAGDMITNGWRGAWQGRYGAGGRGMMAVGRPYHGYITWGMTAAQSEGWVAASRFGRQHIADGPALGLTGFTQTARRAGATLGLTADSPAQMFDRFTLCGLAGPDQGAVRVQMGPVQQDIDFRRPETGPVCTEVRADAPQSQVGVTTLDDHPVSLTSWETRRSAGGIVLANLGVVGTQFVHFTRNDDAVMGLELRQAHPDLLVIAFGTNEGFNPGLDLNGAEAIMRDQIERMRRLLGYSPPILILGPPDALTNHREIAGPAIAETRACGGGWYLPGNIMRMRRMEMDVARQMGLAFWDWQQAMGGPCASLRWVAQGLQRGDHIHFTVDGGRRLGLMLAADLDRALATLPRP